MTGRFIVFEGLDGSGKTTQMHRIQQRMAAAGIPADTTCEPTDGPVGRLIRRMLSGEVDIDQRTLAALFAADRTDHIVTADTGLAARINAGHTILCDRYYFSSYAYHAQYLDMDWVITLNALNARILRPSLTIFIDVTPDTCLARITAGRDHREMYEKIDVLEKVRHHYFTAFERLKDHETVAVVDGNAPEREVEAAVWQHMARMIHPG